MHWDGTVTLGTMIEIASIIVIALSGWSAFKARIAVFEETLNTHAKALLVHGERLDRHEDKLITIVGDLQRVIGHMESDRLYRRRAEDT